MDKNILAKRIKEEREYCGLTQAELAHQMNWKSHATIVAIENGEREIKTWELFKIATILKVSPKDLCTEKSSPKTENYVLWRQMPSSTEAIKQHENSILLACQDYRLVEKLVGNTVSHTRELPLKKFILKEANINWANQLADEVHQEFQLGNYPAESLAKCLEEDFGILIIPQHLTHGSAACTRGGLGSAIILNDKEAPWRQVFSLAHELFHLITWDPVLIKQINTDPELFKKNESLGAAFAAALLMPYNTVNSDIRDKKLTFSYIVALARKYRVSTEAMLWRLSYLKFIPRDSVEKTLKDQDFKTLDKSSHNLAYNSANSLGGRFLRLAYLAYESSLLSKSRFARMLGLKLQDLDFYLQEKGFFITNDKTIETADS